MRERKKEKCGDLVPGLPYTTEKSEGSLAEDSVEMTVCRQMEIDGYGTYVKKFVDGCTG